MKRLFSGLALFVLAAGCSSDKVSWEFVSNTSSASSTGGGAVIVITRGSASPATLPTRSLQFEGEQRERSVRVRLSTSSDAVVIERPNAVEVRCPSLPDGFVLIADGRLIEAQRGASLWEVGIDEAGTLHPSAIGPGRLLVAARGNVLVLEHLGGLVVYGDRPDPFALPGWSVDASGNYLQVSALGQPTKVLFGSAPPALEQRVTWNSSRGSIRILGPAEELLAEVPDQGVQLANGVGGVFLRGEFAAGLGGATRPFTLVAATDNRYLLRVDG